MTKTMATDGCTDARRPGARILWVVHITRCPMTYPTVARGTEARCHYYYYYYCYC